MTTYNPDRLDRIEYLVAENSKAIEQNTKAIAHLTTEIEKTDYKFTVYQQSSKRLLSLATTVIIGASSVAILPSAINAITTLINSFTTILGAK